LKKQKAELGIYICAGEMPPSEANGTAYLKIPINAL